MKSGMRNELLLIDILSAIPAAVLTVSNIPFLNVVLGLPFLLFVPGYLMSAALFPAKGNLKRPDRMAMSFGLSICITVFASIILHFTPVDLNIITLMFSLYAFSIIASFIGMVRRASLPETERGGITLDLNWPGQPVARRAISAVLILAIIGTISAIGYASIAASPDTPPTAFYLLNQAGKTADYPVTVHSGEPVTVTVGIVNNEKRNVTFRLEIVINGEVLDKPQLISIGDHETWEHTVTFTPVALEENVPVTFYLYRNAETEPVVSPLRLWLKITG